MPVPLEKIYEELRTLSAQLSEQTRTIALSSLALVWLFLAGGKDAPVLPTPPSRSLLLAAGGSAVASLVIDYFQYLVGYHATDAVRERAESEEAVEAEYDYTDWRYRLRTWFFWLKQAVALASISFVALAVFRALFSSPPSAR